MNQEQTTDPEANADPRKCHCSAASIAKKIVDQWEHHDRYRITDADTALFSNGLEPDDVVLARAFLQLDQDVEFVQITATGVQNTSQTQCDYVLHGLDKSGRVWEQRNTDQIWRPLAMCLENRSK